MLHGDYHPNNVLIQNNEAVLIDLDTLSVGNPIFEFSYMRNALVSFSDYDPTDIERFLGFSLEVSKRFWKLIIEKYFDTKDEEFFNQIDEKASLVGYVRILRRVIRHKNEMFEEKFKLYKNKLMDLIDKVDTLKI